MPESHDLIGTGVVNLPRIRLHPLCPFFPSAECLGQDHQRRLALERFRREALFALQLDRGMVITRFDGMALGKLT